MKRLFTSLILLAACILAGAQTPEEITRKMSEQLDRADLEGCTMVMKMKLPILGEIYSKHMVSGDKMKSEVHSKEKHMTIWADETTEWTYDHNANEITIDNRKIKTDASDEGNLSTFDSITNGYDLTMEKETAEAWYILCRKSRSNKDKDDPKKMNLVVSKATYLPLSLQTKQSFVSVSIENITIGVTPESVTFNPDAFPTAKIVDKRQ